jgi:DNA invertase Pin-like site-specific DNA recombinase
MYQMLGVFAEFERAIVVERVHAGLARAKAQGTRLGRPKVAGEVEARIRELRAGGAGIKAVAKRLGVGVGTVQRVDRERHAQDAVAGAGRGGRESSQPPDEDGTEGSPAAAAQVARLLAN